MGVGSRCLTGAEVVKNLVAGTTVSGVPARENG